MKPEKIELNFQDEFYQKETPQAKIPQEYDPEFHLEKPSEPN